MAQETASIVIVTIVISNTDIIIFLRFQVLGRQEETAFHAELFKLPQPNVTQSMFSV